MIILLTLIRARESRESQDFTINETRESKFVRYPIYVWGGSALEILIMLGSLFGTGIGKLHPIDYIFHQAGIEFLDFNER